MIENINRIKKISDERLIESFINKVSNMTPARQLELSLVSLTKIISILIKENYNISPADYVIILSFDRKERLSNALNISKILNRKTKEIIEFDIFDSFKNLIDKYKDREDVQNILSLNSNTIELGLTFLRNIYFHSIKLYEENKKIKLKDDDDFLVYLYISPKIKIKDIDDKEINVLTGKFYVNKEYTGISLENYEYRSGVDDIKDSDKNYQRIILQ